MRILTYSSYPTSIPRPRNPIRTTMLTSIVTTTFVVAASQQGANLSRLCAEFEISRPTGYLWLARYGWGGLAGISERSRRPRLSPRRTEERIEQRIVALRAERPDWGARKLAVLLGREG